MESIKNGSCLCKEVHYQVEGDFDCFYLCHCSYCQKDTGSAHSANLFSSNSRLKWTKGESYVRTFTLPSTRHVKSFCSKCGSALPSIQNNGELLVIPAGSLDTPITIKPNAHLFTDSRADWDNKLEALDSFTGLPS
ncbi:GFA family protein [Halobacteriovorax marinus]|uniref:GFA family protein n=1 Tax=Halobacteriovorax marinus TaxID=97084 RepID=UPI003A92D8F1